jgi:flagellar protein FlgJ
MNLGPIANLTPQHQASDARGVQLDGTQLDGARLDGAQLAEQRKAAQQFEAIFLRQLLGSLEKAGGFAGSSDSGSAIFGSMMVSALADNAAASGGIGLADIIFQAMMPPAAPAARDPGAAAPVTSGEGGATPQLLPALPGGS